MIAQTERKLETKLANENDLSVMDSYYFLDEAVYNCPFCNRRNVKYEITHDGYFHPSNSKASYYYVVRCTEKACFKSSFHLSNYNMVTSNGTFVMPPQKYVAKKAGNGTVYKERHAIVVDEVELKRLDDAFYHHEPTSFFTIDERIPKSIRVPLNEADNCRRNDYRTGASACLRKSIYKLLKDREIPDKGEKGDFYTYDQRLDLFKAQLSEHDQDLVNDLKSVQGIASQELHENEWPDLNNSTLRFLIATVMEILGTIYVAPKERDARKKHIAELKAKIASSGAKQK